jgi:hypothetical protein
MRECPQPLFVQLLFVSGGRAVLSRTAGRYKYFDGLELDKGTDL